MSPEASGFPFPHGAPVSVQVLEMCVNHCGEKFHNEVAKFRFLNELIKVLSPKVSSLGLAGLHLLAALYLPQPPDLLVLLLGPELGLLTTEPVG